MSRGGEQWYINPQKTQPSQNLVQTLVTCFKQCFYQPTAEQTTYGTL